MAADTRSTVITAARTSTRCLDLYRCQRLALCRRSIGAVEHNCNVSIYAVVLLLSSCAAFISESFVGVSPIRSHATRSHVVRRTRELSKHTLPIIATLWDSSKQSDCSDCV